MPASKAPCAVCSKPHVRGVHWPRHKFKSTPTTSETGAEELRRVVRLVDTMTESFNDRFNAEELLTLVRMCWASEYDILPDAWTKEQVTRALKGEIPRWEYKNGDYIPVLSD